MTINEIKKALYKEKPMATMTDDGVSGTRGASAITIVTYHAKFSGGSIDFCVPTHEMGANHFGKQQPAHLLIRWIEESRFKSS